MKNYFIYFLMAVVVIMSGYIYFQPITAVETVEKYITEKPEIVDILKEYPDIEQKVKNEARIREIKAEITVKQSEIDTLTEELVKLEDEGFTKASIQKEN